MLMYYQKLPYEQIAAVTGLPLKTKGGVIYPLPDEAITLDLLIGRLPDKYRAVMALKARGLSEKDIADTLGITTGTVKSRFSRGKEMLQKLSGEVV